MSFGLSALNIKPPPTSASESCLRRRCLAGAIDIALLLIGLAVLGPVHWGYIVLLGGMFLLRDWKSCYSPGKRLFHVTTRGISGEACGARESVLRNITLLPPLGFIELALLLFTNEARRLGDTIAFTRVELESDSIAEDALRVDGRGVSAADHSATAAEPADGPAPLPMPPDNGDETACDLVLAALSDVPGGCQTQTTSASDSTIADDAQPASGTVAAPVAPAAIDLSAAAACIGIEGEITYESLDDAYWRYVDRYSIDAVEKLDDAELRARCAELAARKAEPAAYQPTPPPPRASRGECLHYLNAWLVIVNRCRDALA